MLWRVEQLWHCESTQKQLPLFIFAVSAGVKDKTFRESSNPKGITIYISIPWVSQLLLWLPPHPQYQGGQIFFDGISWRNSFISCWEKWQVPFSWTLVHAKPSTSFWALSSLVPLPPPLLRIVWAAKRQPASFPCRFLWETQAVKFGCSL